MPKPRTPTVPQNAKNMNKGSSLLMPRRMSSRSRSRHVASEGEPCCSESFRPAISGAPGNACPQGTNC
eukprot:3338214-Prymnesium_polylepis.1